MTVTCATVRRAFGEFQCCPICHDGSDKQPVCCNAAEHCAFNGVSREDIQTHPALLKAMEEEANA